MSTSTAARAEQEGTTQPGLPPMWWIAIASAAALKTAFQMATSPLYGLHRDEFYYLASGRHLAFGYVDNPPLVPWLYRLADVLFGSSPEALAVIPALIGGAIVILAAALARELGGGRRAQLLTAVAAWLGPLYLTTSHFLSTESAELALLGLAAWIVLRLMRTGQRQWWLPLGATLGLAVLAKDTAALWAVTSLVGLAAIGQRRLLASWWVAAGMAAAAILIVPNVLWEASHGWATVTFLGHLDADNRSSNLTQYLPLQLAIVTLGGTAVWVSGLRAGLGRGHKNLHGQSGRWVAVSWAMAFVVLFATGGKPYYIGAWYLPLVALGAVAVEASWSGPAQRRVALAVVATGLLTAPLFTPVLPESALVAAHFDTTNKDLGGMLGWPHLVATVAAAAKTVPPGERPRLVVLTNDYSEAGAIDYYGRTDGLPNAISGHNTFWWWGWGAAKQTDPVLAVGIPEATVRRYWGRLTEVATLGSDGVAVDPQERGAPVWLCQNQLLPWASLWPNLRHYD
ncbi:MAG: glycosyltransferase family 39 protein [Acidimicrobiales bacterium]